MKLKWIALVGIALVLSLVAYGQAGTESKTSQVRLVRMDQWEEQRLAIARWAWEVTTPHGVVRIRSEHGEETVLKQVEGKAYFELQVSLQKNTSFTVVYGGKVEGRLHTCARRDMETTFTSVQEMVPFMLANRELKPGEEVKLFTVRYNEDGTDIEGSLESDTYYLSVDEE